MNDKPTPGPWVVDRRAGDQKLIVKSEDWQGLDVCIVQPWLTHDEANARFIADARAPPPGPRRRSPVAERGRRSALRARRQRPSRPRRVPVPGV